MWAGKTDLVSPQTHILIEDESLSWRADSKASGLRNNLLIKGKNIPALQALEGRYAEKIKCIYIDPPYNTGSDFEHYDDNLAHSGWLSHMRQRLVHLRALLAEDGFLCCHIDDSEGPYLKVLLDEVFGREHYLATLYVRVRYPQKTLKQDMDFHREVECIHIYRKSSAARPNLHQLTTRLDKFCYGIEVMEGPSRTLTLGGKQVEVFAKNAYRICKGEGREDGLKEIWASGTILDGNSSGRFFRDHLAGREHIDGLGSLYRVTGIGHDELPYRFFTGPKRLGATKGKYFQGVPSHEGTAKPLTQPIMGFYDLAGAFGNCRHEGGVEFRSGKKPEVLLELILGHFSAPGDMVLDAFAGSGTTGAVAHKMQRSWIMIEAADHFLTKALPRMKSVVDGTDLSGVTQAQQWKGGGGFRVLKLGLSIDPEDRTDSEC
jgi:adenine-specific DNA-methyltransferase